MGVQVKVSGPFLTGDPAKRWQQVKPKVIKAVTEFAETEIHTTLQGAIEHETGRYEAAIHSTVDNNCGRVSDGGVVYGPWLEGLSSRNHSTDFGGYHAFRKAKRRVYVKASDIAQPIVARFVQEENA